MPTPELPAIHCPQCGNAMPLSAEILRSASVTCGECGNQFATAAALDALGAARANATVSAIMESDLADECADYLGRGRALAGATDAEAQRRWQVAFRAAVNQGELGPLNAAHAELRLRGLEPDVGPVQAEMAKLHAMIRQHFQENPEGPPWLAQKIAAYRRAAKDKPN